MKKFLVFIPNTKFFEKYSGIGGHITHLFGVIEGLNCHNIDVDVRVSKDAKKYLVEDNSISHLNANFLYFHNFILPVTAILHIFFLIRMARRYDRIYVRYSQSYVPIIWIFGLLFQDKVIVEVNSLGSQYRNWFRLFDAFFLGSVSNFLCVSDDNARQLKSLKPSFESKNIFVVSNGISYTKVSKNRKQSFTRNFCYVGVLKSGYGLEEMIDSFLQINWRYEKLTIIGDGPLLKYFQNKYDHDSRVELRGPLHWSKIIEFVDAKKPVLLYPSVGTFSFQSPIKIYEYLGLGLPILSQLSPNTQLLYEQLPYFDLIDLNSPIELDGHLENFFDDPTMRLNTAYDGLLAVSRDHTWENRIDWMLKCLKR